MPLRPHARVPPQSIQQGLEEIFGAVADEGFRERLRLNEKKPVKKHSGELFGNILVEQVGRHNVQDDELSEKIRIVQCHPMGGAAAAIMAHHSEFLES